MEPDFEDPDPQPLCTFVNIPYFISKQQHIKNTISPVLFVIFGVNNWVVTHTWFSEEKENVL